MKSHDSLPYGRGVDEQSGLFEFDKSSKRIRDRAFGIRTVIINESFWNREVSFWISSGARGLWSCTTWEQAMDLRQAYRTEKDVTSATRFL